MLIKLLQKWETAHVVRKTRHMAVNVRLGASFIPAIWRQSWTRGNSNIHGTTLSFLIRVTRRPETEIPFALEFIVPQQIDEKSYQ